MIERIFTTLTQAVEGTAAIAIAASFVWGILSILLSPCHLASIPLIVGFVDRQGQISTKSRRRGALWKLFCGRDIFCGWSLPDGCNLNAVVGPRADEYKEKRITVSIDSGAYLRDSGRALHLCVYGADSRRNIQSGTDKFVIRGGTIDYLWSRPLLRDCIRGDVYRGCPAVYELERTFAGSDYFKKGMRCPRYFGRTVPDLYGEIKPLIR